LAKFFLHLLTIFLPRSVTVRRRCVKILQQIFSMEAREAALPYIHTAAPIVIRSLLSDQVSRIHI
jgi:hypothetical protein